MAGRNRVTPNEAVESWSTRDWFLKMNASEGVSSSQEDLSHKDDKA